MLALVLCGLFSGQLLLAQSANRPQIHHWKTSLIIWGSAAQGSHPGGRRMAFLAPENKRLNVWLCDTGRDGRRADMNIGAISRINDPRAVL